MTEDVKELRQNYTVDVTQLKSDAAKGICHIFTNACLDRERDSMYTEIDIFCTSSSFKTILSVHRRKLAQI